MSLSSRTVRFTRHTLVAGVAALLPLVASAADPVTVVSWGGTYGAAQDAALFNDASKNSGIEIIRSPVTTVI